MKYTFYEDAGHGWLKVPKVELISLGIAEKITAYSYQKDGNAFLEEDCDFTTFFNAKVAKGEFVKGAEWAEYFVTRLSNYSPIRNYNCYKN